MLILLNFNLANGMAVGKGGEFVFTVGKAFLKPGLKLSEEGKLYSTIIPIPPVNLTANINEAYTAAKQMLTNNSKEFESKVRLLKDDAGNIIKDADGNVHGEIEVTLNNGSTEKVEVLLNEDEAKLKQAAGEIDESGNINNAESAASLIAKWDNLTADEVKQLFNSLSKSEIKIASSKQWGAATANSNFKLNYITDHIDFENFIPPYKKGTFADEILLANDALFVRVHFGKNEVGQWMMTIEDYKALMKDPAKFKDVYALPEMPTKASLVKVPQGTTIWKGQAADNQWGNGGGIQIQIDNFIKIKKDAEDWFQPLENLNY